MNCLNYKSVVSIIDLAAIFLYHIGPFLSRYFTSLRCWRRDETLIQSVSGRINMEDLSSPLSDMLTGHSAVGRALPLHTVPLP